MRSLELGKPFSCSVLRGDLAWSQTPAQSKMTGHGGKVCRCHKAGAWKNSDVTL